MRDDFDESAARKRISVVMGGRRGNKRAIVAATIAQICREQPNATISEREPNGRLRVEKPAERVD